MNIAAAVVMVFDRTRLAALIHDVDLQAVALVRRLSLIVIVVMIVVDRGSVSVGEIGRAHV